MGYSNHFDFLECTLDGLILGDDDWEALFEGDWLEGHCSDLPYLCPSNDHESFTGRLVKVELQRIARELPGLKLLMEVSWDPMGSSKHKPNTRWRISDGKLYESNEIIVVEWGDWEEVAGEDAPT